MRAEARGHEQPERDHPAAAELHEVCVGESVKVLGQIRQPAVSLALWRRWPDASLADWLATTLPARAASDCARLKSAGSRATPTPARKGAASSIARRSQAVADASS